MLQLGQMAGQPKLVPQNPEFIVIYPVMTLWVVKPTIYLGTLRWTGNLLQTDNHFIQSRKRGKEGNNYKLLKEIYRS